MSEPGRTPALVAASAGTALAGLGFIGIGISSLVVRAAAFATSVGVMLIAYGVLVLLIAAASARGYGLATGAMVAAALLHVLTVGSLIRGPGWYWAALVLVVPLATLVAALWVRLEAARTAA